MTGYLVDGSFNPFLYFRFDRRIPWIAKKKNLTVCILFGLLLAVAFLACLFLPKEATSDSERRKLAAMPAFTLDTVLSGRFMSGFETYTQDHFLPGPVPYTESPVRHRPVPPAGQQWDLCFRRFAAAVEYPLNESSLDRAAGRFQYLYDKYLNGSNRVFLSVIPDKNCFLARESGHLSMDYAQLESLMAQKVALPTISPSQTCWSGTTITGPTPIGGRSGSPMWRSGWPRPWGSP